MYSVKRHFALRNGNGVAINHITVVNIGNCHQFESQMSLFRILLNEDITF